MSSPAVRAYLVTLSCEAGGNLDSHGMATIGFDGSTAVVPAALATSVLRGKWDRLQETEA